MPKRLTISEQLARGLKCLGYVETKSTTHYRVFTKPGIFYYVGAGGALRYNETGKVTNTRVCGEKTRARVLAATVMNLDDLFT